MFFWKKTRIFDLLVGDLNNSDDFWAAPGMFLDVKNVFLMHQSVPRHYGNNLRKNIFLIFLMIFQKKSKFSIGYWSSDPCSLDSEIMKMTVLGAQKEL